MAVLKFPPKLLERHAASLAAFLEPMPTPRLLHVARIALCIADDAAPKGRQETNKGLMRRIVTAHAALGMILDRVAVAALAPVVN
jgi:hypothetical protein